MPVSYPTKIRLASSSGGVCAMPECNRPLFDPSPGRGLLGVAAHIAGERPGSARHDRTMTPEVRNAVENLIYLCPNCHRLLDASPDEYPVVRLREIKAVHERRFAEAMRDTIPNIGFPELDELALGFLDPAPVPSDPDFTLVPPEDKLALNQLGAGSRLLIECGLDIAPQVKAFLESRQRIDSHFTTRLKNRFLREYTDEYLRGRRGDELFTLLCNTANRGHFDPLRQMVGIAVLAYLFESCDLFEK